MGLPGAEVPVPGSIGWGGVGIGTVGGLDVGPRGKGAGVVGAGVLNATTVLGEFSTMLITTGTDGMVESVYPAKVSLIVLFSEGMAAAMPDKMALPAPGTTPETAVATLG